MVGTGTSVQCSPSAHFVVGTHRRPLEVAVGSHASGSFEVVDLRYAIYCGEHFAVISARATTSVRNGRMLAQ